MKFIEPDEKEIAGVRADPLLFEQELDARPEVAQALERAAGKRAGRVYWRSANGHLYALELADLGRGRPSMATIYGMWKRYEPRPPDDQIDSDLIEFCLWFAEIAPGLEPEHLARVLSFAGHPVRWP
jgi:hypothetical protein